MMLRNVGVRALLVMSVVALGYACRSSAGGDAPLREAESLEARAAHLRQEAAVKQAAAREIRQAPSADPRGERLNADVERLQSEAAELQRRAAELERRAAELRRTAPSDSG